MHWTLYIPIRLKREKEKLKNEKADSRKKTICLCVEVKKLSVISN